jgi:phosphoglycolate phosphatase-like HAD superfamily hydrolase
MPLDIARIRALCFDVDGTLSDTDDYYALRFSKLLAHIPFVVDTQRTARRLVMWMESPGNALLGMADSLGLDGGMVALISWMYRHRRHESRPIPLIPGVADLLARIHGYYPLAVVSARDENTTAAFLTRSGLAQYFDVIVTALSAKRTKPYPDPIELAARRFGLAPQSCLMIGDTTIDIRAGRAAGAQTVGVLCGFGEEPELLRQGADLILPSTADLADVLFAKPSVA